jgi:hypothetical protein
VVQAIAVDVPDQPPVAELQAENDAMKAEGTRPFIGALPLAVTAFRRVLPVADHVPVVVQPPALGRKHWQVGIVDEREHDAARFRISDR